MFLGLLLSITTFEPSVNLIPLPAPGPLGNSSPSLGGFAAYASLEESIFAATSSFIGKDILPTRSYAHKDLLVFG